MLDYLLRNSDFSALSKLLTPALWRTIPPRVAIKFLTTIYKNQSQLTVWGKTVDSLSNDLKSVGAPYITISDRAEVAGNNNKITKLEAAHQILELYFFQVISRRCWILDFRGSAFHNSPSASQGLQWTPRPLFFETTSNFSLGISDLYYGHYLSDEKKFTEGLKCLGLEQTREVIRRHFGSGDLTNYRFELATFQNTFSELIQSCSKNGIQVDVDFLALGAMLIGLYQTLEAVGQLNVQLCYQNALKKHKS